jgi:hypothetical protein
MQNAPSGYTSRTCRAPRIDGEYCDADTQCKSGHCIDYICGTP